MAGTHAAGNGSCPLFSPRRPSGVGQVALYGLRRWAGEGLTAIACRSDEVSYSSMSRRDTEVAQWLREDPQFRNRVEQGTDDKIKTWPP